MILAETISYHPSIIYSIDSLLGTSCSQPPLNLCGPMCLIFIHGLWAEIMYVTSAVPSLLPPSSPISQLSVDSRVTLKVTLKVVGHQSRLPISDSRWVGTTHYTLYEAIDIRISIIIAPSVSLSNTASLSFRKGVPPPTAFPSVLPTPPLCLKNCQFHSS